MVKIEIDGKELEVPQGQMIIEAADQIGIPIPRFCYHKKLSIAANCRMCLVEVANAPKPLPACATPVSEGMKIFTTSGRARDAQKSVMEFLLINHPLDCPVCDQGGQCELQDVAMEYGKDVSRYTETKRVVKDKDIGPLISTEMTRCIHCTRCVRFGAEVAGVREMGATGRGEFMQIGTFIEKSITSELSGNVIDLCPVGALTSKPFRFKARAWELQSRPSISPHDSLGSHLFYHVIRDKVIRALPREKESINEVWLSDRDRFSYEGLNHADRLEKPLIKRDGQWIETPWQEALEFAVAKLQGIIASNGASALGALASPNCTLEEFYLLQKWWRGLGSENIDCRMRQMDFAINPNPEFGLTLPELESQNAILLIGCDIRKEQPLIAHRLRKAHLKGAHIYAVQPLAIDYNFSITKEVVPALGDLVAGLDEFLKLSKFTSGEKHTILLGNYAITHPRYSEIYVKAQQLAEKIGATLGIISEGANSLGAIAAGALPQNDGLNALQMWQNGRKGYLLLNCEPEWDCSVPALANQALQQAQAVVVLSAFDNPNFREYADVILPITPMTETDGTYINGFNEWQRFNAVVSPLSMSRPAWKVLRVLANISHVDGFNYETIDEVFAEIQNHPRTHSMVTNSTGVKEAYSMGDGLIRLAPIPLYSVDGITRRANSLQKTMDAQASFVRINRHEAQLRKLKAFQKVWVTQDGKQINLPLSLEIDESLPNGVALVPGGTDETQMLGAPYGKIELIPMHEGEPQ